MRWNGFRGGSRWNARLHLPLESRIANGPSGEALDALLGRIADRRETLAAQHGKRVPIFVKIAPDLDDAQDLKSLVAAVNQLRAEGRLLAYHDRSDGGLWAAACEMAFASGSGVELQVDSMPTLFTEELGAILEVPADRLADIMVVLNAKGIGALGRVVGRPTPERRVVVTVAGQQVIDESVRDLAQAWDEVSWRITRLRDNPACADEEHAALGSEAPGLVVAPTFDPADDIAAPYLNLGARPKVAILREQGVNGQIEMAAAFDRAGLLGLVHDLYMAGKDNQAFLHARFALAGDEGMKSCRTVEIMSDAAHAIFKKPAREFSGNFLIDDSFLYAEGERDFDKYRVDHTTRLMPDFFVPADSVPPPGVVIG